MANRKIRVNTTPRRLDVAFINGRQKRDIVAILKRYGSTVFQMTVPHEKPDTVRVYSDNSYALINNEQGHKIDDHWKAITYHEFVKQFTYIKKR